MSQSPNTSKRTSKMTSKVTSKISVGSKIVKTWRDQLAEMELKTENFASETLLLVESAEQCFQVVDKLVPYILEVEQSRIRVITADDIKKMAEGETPMKSLGELAPILKKAIADAKLEMKTKGVMSTELEALFVKIKLLAIRNQYVSHKENYYALQKALEEENNTLLVQEEAPQGKGKGKGKGKEKAAKKSPKGKKGKSDGPPQDPCEEVNKSQYPLSVEIRKKMKALKQSEDFTEPEEGIDIYFILAKIYNYELYQELQNIGIEIISLVDLASNPTCFSIDINYVTPFDGPSSDEEVRKIDISNFWRACGINTGDRLLTILDETCYLRYCPKLHLDEEEIYSDLIRISKNLTDFKRLHKEYLDSMRIFDVEEIKPPVKVRCMNTYNKILNKIPNEFQTYPIILHALIEEVIARLPELEVDKNSTYKSPYGLDRDQPPKKPNRHGGAREQIIKLFKKFERKEPQQTLECKVTLCETKKINYGNALEYMLAHAPYGKDLKDIYVKALNIIEPISLFQYYKPPDPANTLAYDFLFYKWANDFEGVPINKLRHCIHAYLMTHGKFFDPPKVPEYKSKKKTVNLLFMNHKPYNKGCKRNPSVHLAFLLSTHLRNLFKRTKFGAVPKPAELGYCEHVEEYDSQTMAQILYHAFKNIKRYQYRYFEAHDVLLLRFRPVIRKTTAVPYDFLSIRSPVCFRDFCAYIIRKEIDWLCKKEELYWLKQVEDSLITKAQSIDEAYILNPEDFIMPGSLKDKSTHGGLSKGPSKSSKIRTRGSKTKTPSNKSKTPSSKTKNALSKTLVKEEPKITRSSMSSKRNVSTVPEPKVYDFEGYNVSTNFMQLRHLSKVYSTVDGYKISVEKYHWKMQTGHLTLKATINDNWLVYHFIEDLPYITCHPVKFNLHVSNGIIMVFQPPKVHKMSVPPCDKSVATYEYQKMETTRKSPVFRQDKKPDEEIQAEMQNPKYITTKKDILDKIKMAVKSNIPLFKICSTRLHKYHYVKRIKSHIEVPIGRIVKRLTHKPKIYKKLKRNYLVTKCLPSTEVVGRNGFSLDFDFTATLPTGLCIQTIQGIHSYPIYIKQGYILDREDLKSIEDEDYRCFIKGKVLSFQKNGEVKAMHFNKVIENRQYGYFSSNVHESVTKPDQLRKTGHSYNLHKATRNIPKMERKIRSICLKYSKHLIGLSENYRLASKREVLKKEKNTYKLSKKIYQLVPNMLPLLKLTTITQDGSKITADTRKIVEEDNKYYTLTYNDYMKRETLVYRQDGTMWFLDNDGKATTQFPDSTRITTWFEILDEELLICLDDEEYINEEQNEMSNEDEVEKVSCTLESCNFPCEKDAFVLYGINYKYEHPNYMTVTELCADDSIVVDFPGNVSVKIFKDGTYIVNLQNDETVNIKKNLVEIKAQSCSKCNFITKCKIKMKHLYSKKRRILPEENLLWLLDRESNLIRMDYAGNLTEEIYLPDPNHSACTCDKLLQDRYFVLRRDLSGAELFQFPPPNKFIYTMQNFPAKVETKAGQQNATCLMQHIYKTYSENLMMLYDIPMLGMVSNFIDSEELFRSFDYDEKSVILLRTPLYLIERTIYHLQLYNVIESLVSGFYTYLHHNEDCKRFKPSSSLVKFIKENTPAIDIPIETLPLPIPPVKKPYKSKFRDLAKRKKEYKKLLSMPRPKYFDSHVGQAFQYIDECIERAFAISERLAEEKQKRQDSETSYMSKDSPSIPITNFEDWSCTHTIYSTDMFLKDFADPDLICKERRDEVCEEICNVFTPKVPSEMNSEEHQYEFATTESVVSVKSSSPARPSLYCQPEHCCPTTPKCSEVSICTHTEKVSLRGSYIITTKREFSGKTIARDILFSLYSYTEDGNIDALTNTEVQKILIDEIRVYKLTHEYVEDIVNAFHHLIFVREGEGSSLFATAIGVIEEAKSVAEKLGEEYSDAPLDLEDMTVKASCIMYNVLDSPDSKGDGIIEIQKLFEEAKLSKKDAHKVLELTAQGLEQDLRGSSNAIIFEKPLRISSECAIRIADQLEKVTHYLLLKQDSDYKKSTESLHPKHLHYPSRHHHQHKNKKRESVPKMYSQTKASNLEMSASTVDNFSSSSLDQKILLANIDSINTEQIESHASITKPKERRRTYPEDAITIPPDFVIESYLNKKDRRGEKKSSVRGKERNSEVMNSFAKMQNTLPEESSSSYSEDKFRKRKSSVGTPRKKSGASHGKVFQKRYSRYTSETEERKKDKFVMQNNL